ncbi:MAG TPA: DUF1345 domain-containing protein [Polyangiaceae bacterium]|jgi:uncharacterized membrane protein|nr:DUF1345 domain-containing protein [Polyangiaceae bacterium]
MSDLAQAPIEPEPNSQVPAALAPRTSGRRLFVSVSLGALVGGLARVGIPSLGWAVHVVSGWDAAGLTLLALAWWRIFRDDATQTRKHAAKEDPGRTLVWAIVLLASAASLFAAGFVMRKAHTIAPSEAAFSILVGLCLTAVASAWALTHTAYTLRYAHLYYRDDEEGEGGLDFPGKLDPNAVDFAYFAFTLGMCFQTSDVAVTSRNIRRAVLAHALLSFLYNTVVLALAFNLVLGFLN